MPYPDFSRSEAGKRINLSFNNGRWQAVDRLGNRVSLMGVIENVIGTKHNDLLIGNAADNLIDGRGGSNRLHGVGGNNILIGGAGNDLLVGGLGIDILIGGLGRDQLFGRTGGDLLIGGATHFELIPEALYALRAEWTSGRTYTARIANLTDGSGSADRLNGDFFLDQSTVIDDLARDRLAGGPGRNWYVIRPGDGVVGRRPGEVVTVIPPIVPAHLADGTVGVIGTRPAARRAVVSEGREATAFPMDRHRAPAAIVDRRPGSIGD